MGDAAPFLARLTRLDPATLVRIRATSVTGQAALWGRVPWDVTVTRTVALDIEPGTDLTVSAAGWLAGLTGGSGLAALPRLDAQWRAPLPPVAAGREGDEIEAIPASVIRDIADAAARTLRETESAGLNGRAVGQRALRDALLDHVPIVVTTDTDNVAIPQRLIQAVVRMGFLASESDSTARILRFPAWTGISAAYGTAWWRPTATLGVRAHPW